jgi:hypothetical protein
MKKNKKIWLLVIIALAIVLITLIAKKTTVLESILSPTPSLTTTPKPSLSYTNAVKQYGERRIQFDDHCQAVHNQITVKNNTNFMFDNRSNKKRTIKIDSKAYTIAAYSYRILTFYSAPSTLPHTAYISCDAQPNVATVLIQK